MCVSELITKLQSVLDAVGDIEAVYDKLEKIPMSLAVSYVTVCGVCESEKKFAVLSALPVGTRSTGPNDSSAAAEGGAK